MTTHHRLSFLVILVFTLFQSLPSSAAKVRMPKFKAIPALGFAYPLYTEPQSTKEVPAPPTSIGIDKPSFSQRHPWVKYVRWSLYGMLIVVMGYTAMYRRRARKAAKQSASASTVDANRLP